METPKLVATFLVLHSKYSARGHKSLSCKLCDSTVKTGEIGKSIKNWAQIIWDIVQLMPKSEYDKEIPWSHTADQTKAPRGRDPEH